MSHLIIYSYPLLIDIILGLFIFAGPMRAVENGVSLGMISLLITAYGIGYVLFSLFMSKIIRVRYARLQMVGASLLIAALSITLAFTANIYITLIVFSILPFGTSLFFNSFQAFMKHVGSNKATPMNMSVAIYVLSWSIGFALGPFFGGWIREYFSWHMAFLFAAILGIIVALVAFYFNPVGEESQAEPPIIDHSGDPDLALSGWVGVLTTAIVLSLFLTLFPKQTEMMGMRPGFRGMVIFLQNMVQAGVVFLYARHYRWVYNVAVAPFVGILGVVALVCLYYATQPFLLFVAAVLFGVFGAGYFYAAIYHSLSHPSKSVRNISINEASVGTGFLLGPQLVHLSSSPTTFTRPYLYAILIIAALIVFQYIFIKNKTTHLIESR